MPPPPMPSREVIERFIRERQELAPPPRTWIGRLLRRRLPSELGVGEPWAVDVGGFFQRQRVFDIRADGGVLPFPSLPGGSFGMFSTDGATLHLLSPSSASLEGVLRREGRPLDEADPLAMAQFVSLFYSRGSSWHAVLRDAEHLLKFGEDDPWTGGGYELRPRVWDQVRDRVPPPMISRDPGGGWVLEFASLYGWMHECQELGRERVHVSPAFEVRREPRAVLCQTAFAHTPMILY